MIAAFVIAVLVAFLAFLVFRIVAPAYSVIVFIATFLLVFLYKLGFSL